MKTYIISGSNSTTKSTMVFAVFLILIATATVLYDDPRLGLFKRILYALFSVASIFALFTLIASSPAKLISQFALLKWYFLLYSLFICANLIKTLMGEQINAITLINNPYALTSAISPFAMILGLQFNPKTITKTTPVFLISYLWALINPLASKIPYYMGYVSSFAFYPILLLSGRKNKVLLFLLIVSTIWFSYLSSFRIITLRFAIFFLLLSYFLLFKNSKKFKLLGIIVTISLLITGLFYMERILDTANSLFPTLNVDYDDTRTFLYEEFSLDMKPIEYFSGRGFLGTYYSYYFQNLLSQGDYSDYFIRFTIEVGLLELILKGGILYLIFYWIPLLFSSINGILTKDTALISLSTFLFTESILFGIENVPSYSYMSVIQFILCGVIIKNTKNENINNNANI